MEDEAGGRRGQGGSGEDAGERISSSGEGERGRAGEEEATPNILVLQFLVKF